PSGITASSNSYTGSVSFAETGCPAFAKRTFLSTATRRVVPAGTCSSTTESEIGSAPDAEVGGAQRAGNESSRGISLQPLGIVVCAARAIGVNRKNKSGNKRHWSLDIYIPPRRE